jgi:hypothetical protein
MVKGTFNPRGLAGGHRVQRSRSSCRAHGRAIRLAGVLQALLLSAERVPSPLALPHARSGHHPPIPVAPHHH